MLIWTNSCGNRRRSSLFLDRDGVINRDRTDYIKHWREFDFYPDSLQALREMKEKGVDVILISNQSAINRGLIGWDDFWDLHDRMVHRIVEEGGDLFAAFYCPHRPEENCSCRKPSPGMLLTAAGLFRIPLTSTYMIGDRPTDLLAARQAGCTGVLLERDSPQDLDLRQIPDAAAIGRHATLLQAVRNLFG